MRIRVAAVEAPVRLWEIAGKLRSIGEIFGMCSTGRAPLSDEGLTGLANLLLTFADEIDDVRDALENGR